MRTVIVTLIIAFLYTSKAFGQVEAGEAMWTPEDHEADSLAYRAVEKMPFVSEGMEPYMKWIQDNMDEQLKSTGKKNRKSVHIIFVVKADGTTCCFKVFKGIGEPYDKEALRLVMHNPYAWNAGLHQGKKMYTRQMIPVTF